MEIFVKPRTAHMSVRSFKRRAGTTTLAGSLLLGVAGTTPMLYAQAVSVNGGSIQGTITDNSGAVIPHAQIVISSPQTGLKKTLTADGSGLYTFGPVNPGEYHLSVTAPSYSTLSVDTVVKTGTVTNGNFKLQVGARDQSRLLYAHLQWRQPADCYQ